VEEFTKPAKSTENSKPSGNRGKPNPVFIGRNVMAARHQNDMSPSTSERDFRLPSALKDVGYKFKPEYIEQLLEHMSKGFTFGSFLTHIPVRRSTMYQWVHDIPEWAEAKERGEAMCEEWWINLGRGAAMGQIKNFSGAAWVFTMKNLFQWKDKHEFRADMSHEIREVVHQIEIASSGEIIRSREERKMLPANKTEEQ